MFLQELFHPIATVVWVKIKLVFCYSGSKVEGVWGKFKVGMLCMYRSEGAIQEFWGFKATFFCRNIAYRDNRFK